MFTGLIEQVGEVESARQTDAGRELRVRAPFTDLASGESIAVNGACLTVRQFGPGWFETAADDWWRFDVRFSRRRFRRRKR